MKNRINTILSVFSILIILVGTVGTIGTVNAKSEDKDFVCVEKQKNIATAPDVDLQGKKIDNSIYKKDLSDSLCANGKVPKIKDDINAKLHKDKDGKDVKKVMPRNKDGENEKDEKINGNKDGADADPSILTIGGVKYSWSSAYQNINSTGVYARLSEHSPYVSFWDYHSLAEIGVKAFDGDYAEVGWRKTFWPWDVPRLFVFWWKDGIGQCYNGCGWVQVSSVYYPGMRVYENSYGNIYAIQKFGNNWWVYYKDRWIGYYPGSLWNYGFTKGNRAYYYGEVAATSSSTSTDMGNGRWASDPYAAKITDQSYFGADGYWHSANTYKWASAPYKYSMYSLGPYMMRYGGPG